MGQGSSRPGPTLPPGAGDSEATRALAGWAPATRLDPVRPSYQPTYVPPREPDADVTPVEAPHQPATVAEAAPTGARWRAVPPPTGPPPGGPPPGGPPSALPSSEVVRYGPGVPGPGVPASQAGAESVWRTGHRPGTAARRRGLRRRLRRLLGLALTVILLVAAGVVLWLRFFDHPPFRVTGVAITQQAKSGCTVDVTGRITTNGSAGTVSYQWVFRPQTQAPQPLNQSVVAGQHAVYVTVAVEGQGHGSAVADGHLGCPRPGPGHRVDHGDHQLLTQERRIGVAGWDVPGYHGAADAGLGRVRRGGAGPARRLGHLGGDQVPAAEPAVRRRVHRVVPQRGGRLGHRGRPARGPAV